MSREEKYLYEVETLRVLKDKKELYNFMKEEIE